MSRERPNERVTLAFERVRKRRHAQRHCDRRTAAYESAIDHSRTFGVFSRKDSLRSEFGTSVHPPSITVRKSAQGSI